MDTVSTGFVARVLETTIPRVKRALRELELETSETPKGHTRIPVQDLPRLASALGKAPRIPNLSREDIFVMAALSRRPLGLVSARAVSRAAGVSPTATGRSLERLERLGYVERAREKVVAGTLAEIQVWRISWAGRPWRNVAPLIRSVMTPIPRALAGGHTRLPRRFDHLFWNVNPRELDTKRDGRYIAARILSSNDTQAVAWMAGALDPEAIRAAAALRGTSLRDRALAKNLAAAR